MRSAALVLAFWSASTGVEAQSVYLTAELGAEELEAAIRAELEALDIRIAMQPGDSVEVMCAADGSVEVRGEEAIARFTPEPGEEAGARIVRAAEFVRARLLVAPELRAPSVALADPSASGESGEAPDEPRNASDREHAEDAAREDEAPDEARDDEATEDEATDDEVEAPSAPDPPRRPRGLGTSVGIAGGAWLTEGDVGPQASFGAQASFLAGDLVAITARFFYQLTEPTLRWTDGMSTIDSSAHFIGLALGAEVRFAPIELLELGVGAAVGALRFDATGASSPGTGLAGASAGTWLFWPHVTASARVWFHPNVGAFVSASAGLSSARVIVARSQGADPGVERLMLGSAGPFVAEVTGGIEARWEY